MKHGIGEEPGLLDDQEAAAVAHARDALAEAREVVTAPLVQAKAEGGRLDRRDP